MSDIKQPQDRKTKPTPFTFNGPDGKTHRLPFASEGAGKVSGRFTRDALLAQDDDAAQVRLGFALLEAFEIDDDTLSAIYDRPANETIQILGDWMQHGDGAGASLPKS